MRGKDIQQIEEKNIAIVSPKKTRIFKNKILKSGNENTELGHKINYC